MARHWEPLTGYTFLVTLLLTLTYHSRVAHAGLDRVCSPDMGPTRGGVCGSRIPIIVANVCAMFQNGGNTLTKFLVKRSADQERSAVGESLGSLLLDKKDAFSFFPSKRQVHRRSILCECCYHRCTLLELVQYCELSDHAVNQFRARYLGVNSRSAPTVEDSYS